MLLGLVCASCARLAATPEVVKVEGILLLAAYYVRFREKIEPAKVPAPSWMSHQPTYMGWRVIAYGPVMTSSSGRSSAKGPAERRRRSARAQRFRPAPATSSPAPAIRWREREPGSGIGRSRSRRRSSASAATIGSGSGRLP